MAPSDVFTAGAAAASGTWADAASSGFSPSFRLLLRCCTVSSIFDDGFSKSLEDVERQRSEPLITAIGSSRQVWLYGLHCVRITQRPLLAKAVTNDLGKFMTDLSIRTRLTLNYLVTFYSPL